MKGFGLVPTPDSIPAPWGVFEVLGLLTFVVHIICMNIALGGLLILAFSRLQSGRPVGKEGLPGVLVKSVPVAIPLTITFGVAPLLFIQVNYGHLFYSSSILMALYWIFIIPLLIIAYYGAYVQSLYKKKSPALSTLALFIAAAVFLYIAFAFSNNMTLMLQPEQWIAYFQNARGTVLNLTDPQLIPRFLHMATAAVAVAGLFAAIIWSFKKNLKQTVVRKKIAAGLKLFAYATLAQVLIGFWFLLSQPAEIAAMFTGANLLYTGILWTGIFLSLAAIITAMKQKLFATTILTVTVIVLMSISRAFLRSAYISRFFQMKSLELVPQYSPMILFFVILTIGLIIIAWMLRIAVKTGTDAGETMP